MCRHFAYDVHGNGDDSVALEELGNAEYRPEHRCLTHSIDITERDSIREDVVIAGVWVHHAEVGACDEAVGCYVEHIWYGVVVSHCSAKCVRI